MKSLEELLEKKRDLLLIVSCFVEPATFSEYLGSCYGYPSSNLNKEYVEKMKISQKEEWELRLKGISKHLLNKGFSCSSILLMDSTNIAQSLCQIADEQKVDYLALGKNGFGKIGSISTYCLENSKKNITIIKRDIESDQQQELEEYQATFLADIECKNKVIKEI